MTTEPKIIIPPIESEPHTEKTRAILKAIEDLKTEINKFQDVTAAVRQIQDDRKRWKNIVYRLLKEAEALFFSDREKHK